MSNEAAEPVGTLSVALAHTARLLAANPSMAESQAREILKVVPDQPDARLLLAAALRGQGQADAALDAILPLVDAKPQWAAAQFERGRSLSDLGRGPEAIHALQRAVQLMPDLTDAWRALGDELTLAGQTGAADNAYARHIQASVNDPQLLQAAAALCEGRLPVAERILRPYLMGRPTDVAAIRMLAEVGARLGRYEDAEHLLARCLELAPGFDSARHNYATVLYRQNKAALAIAQVDLLLAREPRNPGYRGLKAAALVHVGEYTRAITAYEALLADYPQQPKGWMSYGHALKTVGRRADAVSAYRRSIGQATGLGEAYWSLANLKTFRFEASDVAAMQTQLERGDIAPEDRFHLHFSLGKALEDAGEYAASFEHYRLGNAQRHVMIGYDAERTTQHMQRSKALFTATFFQQRSAVGCPSPDPIFIVGLPRSGSTLIEQILSSHSAIEGTMELPDIISIARRLGGQKRQGEPSDYPEALRALEPDAFRALGEEYLARTQVHRKVGRRLFIDKMPNNFAHIGLIHLALPNARIIDARRHPMGCCFSGFKQHFARGQGFTYDLEDIGRYYRDYVALMAHFDAVLPGRIHRVIYEQLVEDPEREVRRMLDYCGLALEPACLDFHQNDRAVRTASSEQVRQPIFRDGLDHWRNYAAWLGPLEAALGPVLSAYPDAPIA